MPQLPDIPHIKVKSQTPFSTFRPQGAIGFASSMFLFEQGWSHQSYQLVLQKRRRRNLNDIHFQNVCTNVLVLACIAYTVLFYENFYFRLVVVLSTTKVVCIYKYIETDRQIDKWIDGLVDILIIIKKQHILKRFDLRIVQQFP